MRPSFVHNFRKSFASANRRISRISFLKLKYPIHFFGRGVGGGCEWDMRAERKSPAPGLKGADDQAGNGEERNS
jgi:hypothetical protein